MSPDSGRRGSRGRGSGRGGRGSARGTPSRFARARAAAGGRSGGAASPSAARYPFVSPRGKRILAIALAAGLVLAFVIVAVAQGIGPPSVPEGAVAEVKGVDDGTITQEDFDAAFTRSAQQQGLKKPPEPGDQGYDQLLDSTMNDLLLSRWIQGEAAERGIEITDEEASQRLDQIKQQSFGSDKEFAHFVEQQGYCSQEEVKAGTEPEQCVGVQREVRTQIFAERLQDEVLGNPKEAAAAIPESDVETFYDQNIEQFQQPETRDVRLIQNKDPEKVQKAFELLQKDDSAANWKQVAQQYSSDEASRDRGGLLEGVIQGQSPGGEAFDQQLFSDQAAEGGLIGPFDAEGGTYLLQVQNVNPEKTTPLSDVSDQIRQQLAATQQDALQTQFEDRFFAKWTERTSCADGYVTPDCGNSPEAEASQDPCGAMATASLQQSGTVEPTPAQISTEADRLQGQGACGAPVISSRPAAPGTAGVIGGPTASTTPPQGPVQPPQPSQQQVPATTLGPTGAPVPGAPPGAAVPTAPPGTAAPPTAAPPTAAPPTAPPGTAVPPTAAPPTAPPGTAVPPGAAPPTAPPTQP